MIVSRILKSTRGGNGLVKKSARLSALWTKRHNDSRVVQHVRGRRHVPIVVQHVRVVQLEQTCAGP
eukprot:693862-Pleurochrysis_carterae.AAC.1